MHEQNVANNNAIKKAKQEEQDRLNAPADTQEELERIDRNG